MFEMNDLMMSPELESIINISQDEITPNVAVRRPLMCKLQHENGHIRGALTFFAVDVSPACVSIEVSLETSHDMLRQIIGFNKFTSIDVFDDDGLVFSNVIQDDCNQRYEATPNANSVLLSFFFKKIL